MQETSASRVSSPENQRHAECPVEQVRDDGITVFFDGSCPLCTLEISHYSRLGGGESLTLVDVAGGQNDIGADLSSAEAMKRLHVRLPNGELVSGARAFAAIWNRVSGWRWAASATSLPGVMFLLEIAYRAFLPLRPFLSSLAAKLGARSHQSRNNPP
ncbi:DUF393 domain-containing protein [Pyruvatibacter sp.]|uniref:thiol-disulfide oxidoreductase DCC family protein n=1 Tax=Pyruvatibacter sp. TaxID=1981328 RepID=UPI0032EB94BA